MPELAASSTIKSAVTARPQWFRADRRERKLLFNNKMCGRVHVRPAPGSVQRARFQYAFDLASDKLSDVLRDALSQRSTQFLAHQSGDQQAQRLFFR